MQAKQKYYAWVASEPLSDMCVDRENVAPLSELDGDLFWQAMLNSGKQAVEYRKSEQNSTTFNH